LLLTNLINQNYRENAKFCAVFKQNTAFKVFKVNNYFACKIILTEESLSLFLTFYIGYV